MTSFLERQNRGGKINRTRFYEEEAIQKVLKKVLQEIFQNSQENICALF